MNIVITGASKGMGKAIAEKFASVGNNIFIAARNENELSETAHELHIKTGNRVQYFAADLSDKSESLQFSSWILSQINSVDILINNAGQFIPGSIFNEEEGTLEKMIAVNLYSAY